MGGPLDDALARQSIERNRQQQQAHADHTKVTSLIGDFLRRMNAAGNPGLQRVAMIPGGHRLSRGWEIRFKTGTSEYVQHYAGSSNKVSKDIYSSFVLLPDGNITISIPSNPANKRWHIHKSYTKANLSDYGKYADGIAGAMAEIMYTHGVRLWVDEVQRKQGAL